MKGPIDQLSRQELELTVLSLAEDLQAQLKLTRRFAYYCPIDYISEPFFIIFASHKQKVEAVLKSCQDVD